jgi:hypothetical protein
VNKIEIASPQGTTLPYPTEENSRVPVAVTSLRISELHAKSKVDTEEPATQDSGDKRPASSEGSGSEQPEGQHKPTPRPEVSPDLKKPTPDLLPNGDGKWSDTLVNGIIIGVATAFVGLATIIAALIQRSKKKKKRLSAREMPGWN